MTKYISLLILGSVACIDAHAGTETGQVLIKSVRSITGGTPSVYITLQNAPICNTDTFSFQLTDVGAQGMLSIALTALTTGQFAEIEISNATGCTGWGTQLQSMYLLAR